MDTMNEQLQMDQISRNRMVLDIDSNFFVEAGAGSGKTTMLVNRIVDTQDSFHRRRRKHGSGARTHSGILICALWGRLTHSARC